MSTESHRERPKQEEDRIRTSRVVLIGLIGLATFGIGIGWMMQIERASSGSVRAAATTTPPPLAGQLEVGIVYQKPFEANHPIAATKRTAQERRLAGFGWVDQGRRIVFIPVDQAMERIAAGGKL